MIYLLYTRVDLRFLVHKLEKFLSNPGKVSFEGLVNLLRYIRNNTTLGLYHYANIYYSHLSGLLRQANINTENQLMAFSDSSCQYFPDIGISTGEYIIFYQGGTIDHVTYITGQFSQ